MEKQQQMLSITLILLVFNRDTITQSTSGAANVLGNIPYFQASNTKDQLGSSTGKIAAYDGVDGFNGYYL